MDTRAKGITDISEALDFAKKLHGKEQCSQPKNPAIETEKRFHDKSSEEIMMLLEKAAIMNKKFGNSVNSSSTMEEIYKAATGAENDDAILS